MDALRYGNSFQVFNLISYKWVQCILYQAHRMPLLLSPSNHELLSLCGALWHILWAKMENFAG